MNTNEVDFNDPDVTPVIKQYLEIKADHMDCILMFRMGDFYESFFEDAKIISNVLGINLGKRGKIRGKDIPMSGVPYFAFDNYVKKLIESNYRVAICDQLEESEEAKKRGYKSIVRRGVVRIITSGTIFEDGILPQNKNNFLIAIYFNTKNNEINGNIGIARIDISTGAFFTEVTNEKELYSVIMKYDPSEIIVPNSIYDFDYIEKLRQKFNVTRISDAKFNYFIEKNRVLDFFNVRTLDGIGNFSNEEIISCGAIIEYVRLTQKDNVKISVPKRVVESDYMYLDYSTLKNLEIIKSLTGEEKHSLFYVLKNTLTRMGTRLLSERIISPLNNVRKINERLNGVEFFVEHQDFLDKVRTILNDIPDFERAFTRISYRRGSPSDMGIIRSGLNLAMKIADLFNNDFKNAKFPSDIELISEFYNLKDFDDIVFLLRNAFQDDVLPNNFRTFNFIKSGYSSELDSLRNLIDHSDVAINELQKKYIEETSVTTLKIKFNNIIGYFIEVPNSQKSKMGENFIKKQDTVNSVRYKTEELTILEEQILSANEKSQKLEVELFNKIQNILIEQSYKIERVARAISIIDLTACFADLAFKYNYCKPIFDNSEDFEISLGRHPVVERQECVFGSEESNFIPNDTSLIDEKLAIITGPNMAGKSTYLRQNALFIIMGQMGSFIPAKSARIGVVDKLFSRIGASDDLASGKSTFMVEMTETAAILNQATKKSFVILDEVGRGTSTYDGFAIASSVVDHLYKINKSRTFFATHYHEIQFLNIYLSKLKFLTLRISEHDDDVFFHHKIINGIADKSYGIYVAKIAGLPERSIKYAANLLKTLNKNNVLVPKTKSLDLKFSSDIKNVDAEISSEIEAQRELNKKIIMKIKSLNLESISQEDAYKILIELKKDLCN